MTDILFIVLTVLCFAGAVAYTTGCERLKVKPRP